MFNNDVISADTLISILVELKKISGLLYDIKAELNSQPPKFYGGSGGGSPAYPSTRNNSYTGRYGGIHI